MQLAQNGVTGVLQLLVELAGGKSGGAASNQVINGGGETAVFGEADPSVVPEAISVEVRGIVQGVSLAVLGVTPEVADVLEEAAHRDQGVAESLGELVEHPALAAVEQFFEALGRGPWRRHREMI